MFNILFLIKTPLVLFTTISLVGIKGVFLRYKSQKNTSSFN